ncbi:MAG: hypothetical protein NVS2B7_07610 [Herpetosiphon sp.]
MTKQEHAGTMISRTFRAAIRVGEDFYTIEETVTLPPTATDDDIAQAVDAGERIYQAQRAAVELQSRHLREEMVINPLPIQIRDPEAPASDKQRQYMDYLVTELHWDGSQMQQFAAEHKLDILTLTKREASELIDELKALLDLRANAPAPRADHAERVAEPVVSVAARVEHATQRQLRALERMAEERGIDLAAELDAVYSVTTLDQLNVEEAGQLLTEWQQRPRQLRARTETRRAA